MYFKKLIILLAIFLSEINGKGMWGSKRKRNDDEDDIDILSQSFELKKNQATRMERKSPTIKSQSATSSFNLDSFVGSLDTYISSAEQFINSPQFDAYFNPESMQAILEKVPGISENVQINDAIKALNKLDQNELKLAMNEGIYKMKLYLKELVDISHNPEKLEEIIIFYSCLQMNVGDYIQIIAFSIVATSTLTTVRSLQCFQGCYLHS
jgi:hypothetical protein